MNIARNPSDALAEAAKDLLHWLEIYPPEAPGIGARVKSALAARAVKGGAEVRP